MTSSLKHNYWWLFGAVAALHDRRHGMSSDLQDSDSNAAIRSATGQPCAACHVRPTVALISPHMGKAFRRMATNCRNPELGGAGSKSQRK